MSAISTVSACQENPDKTLCGLSIYGLRFLRSAGSGAVFIRLRRNRSSDILRLGPSRPHGWLFFERSHAAVYLAVLVAHWMNLKPKKIVTALHYVDLAYVRFGSKADITASDHEASQIIGA